MKTSSFSVIRLKIWSFFISKNFNWNKLVKIRRNVGKNNIYFLIFFYIKNGSRKIAPEENCPPALILNQTLTLTGGQFSGNLFNRWKAKLYMKVTYRRYVVENQAQFQNRKTFLQVNLLYKS